MLSHTRSQLESVRAISQRATTWGAKHTRLASRLLESLDNSLSAVEEEDSEPEQDAPSPPWLRGIAWTSLLDVP